MKMGIAATFLSLGLLIIAVISLVVRDVFFVLALSLVALAILTAIGLACTKNTDQPHASRVMIILVNLVLVGVAYTNAPLRLAFTFLESRFEAVGDQLARGEQPDFPTWIGPFRIIDGGVRDESGAPYLMTSGQLHEINGFVRDPRGTYFNLWSITPVSEGWAYIEED